MTRSYRQTYRPFARRDGILTRLAARIGSLVGALSAMLDGGPHIPRRLVALIVVFGAGFLSLLGRQAQLQIIHGDSYFDQSDQRRIRRRLFEPRRGTIVDRNGVILAADVPSFDISIIPGGAGLVSATPDAAELILSATGESRTARRRALIQSVAEIEPLVERIVGLTHCDREQLARAVVKAVENVARRYYNTWDPQVIVADIPVEVWQRLNSVQASEFITPEFQGVRMTTSLRRKYPQGVAGAHVIGHVGLLQKEHYETLRRSGALPSLFRAKQDWWDKKLKTESFARDMKRRAERFFSVDDSEIDDCLKNADVFIARARALPSGQRDRLLCDLSDAGLDNVAGWITQRDVLSLSTGERVWLGDDENQRLFTNNISGETGIEGYYNDRLRGRFGHRAERRTPDGSIFIHPETLESAGLDADGFADDCAPRDGDDLKLTIDIDWQRAAERALEATGQPGAAVFIDPRTGAILALASYPSFDLNDFTPPRSNTVADYINDERHPLINRAIQGLYPQASCIKPVMGFAVYDALALEPDFTIDGVGRVVIGTGKYGVKLDHGGAGSGDDLTLTDALSISSNSFFWQLALRVEDDSIQRWCQSFGYGEKSGIDLPGEAAGLIPSADWKRTRPGKHLNRWDRQWRPGDTCDTAIGLGFWQVTPLQGALLASAIANGGVIVRPHLVETNPSPDPIRTLSLSQDVLELTRQGLYNCVNGSPRGSRFATGFKAFHSAKRLPSQIKVAGKTGSSDNTVIRDPQTGVVKETIQGHGWFLGYAPYDEPTIAFAVVIEHGGNGGISAAPVVNRVLCDVWGE
ncbi:MAG: penicillin-binding transpeptidase domain-containing protein [Planctomycetota bacterium]